MTPLEASAEDIEYYALGLDLSQDMGILIGQVISEFKARGMVVEGDLVKKTLTRLISHTHYG